MNFKTLLVAGSFAAALSAQAVSTISPTGAGELVLGFAAPTVNVNVEVALGNAATYTTLNAGLGALDKVQIGRLNVADLSANFGAWQNRSDISWSIVGFQANGFANTTWASKDIGTLAAAPLGAQTVAWSRGTATSQNNGFGSKVGTMSRALATEVGSSLEYSAVDGSNEFTSIVNVGTLDANDSWSKQVLTTTSYVQADLQADTMMTVTEAFTNGVTVSDLFQMQSGSGAGAYIGSFGIDADGSLWYAKNAAAFAAIPEPSTYAMILGALTLGVVVMRRRLVKQV